MPKQPLELPPPTRSPIPVLTPLTRPRLLLRPLAFLKLTYLCQAAGTEVGGFGLSSEADPLVIDDILLVRQEATAVTVEFDDEAVADLIDTMADSGVPPQRCSRVWVHTHPGSSASPSGTDERTFARSFGGADFSVMLILARGGAFYARLQLIGPVKTAVEIPVFVDWPALPGWMNQQADALPTLIRTWADDLTRKVTAPIGRGFDGFLTTADLLEAADLEEELVAGRHWWEDEAMAASLDDAVGEEVDEEAEEVGFDHDFR